MPVRDRYNLDLQDRDVPASRLQLWLDNLSELTDALRSAKDKYKVLWAS